MAPLELDAFPSNAFELLVNLGVLKPFENYHRLKYEAESNMFSPFSNEVLRASEEGPLVLNKTLDDVGRVTFDSSPIFTIDSPSTVEVDDGVSLETRADGSEWIHIHIADPTRILTPNSTLDLSARTRAER